MTASQVSTLLRMDDIITITEKEERKREGIVPCPLPPSNVGPQRREDGYSISRRTSQSSNLESKIKWILLYVSPDIVYSIVMFYSHVVFKQLSR